MARLFERTRADAAAARLTRLLAIEIALAQGESGNAAQLVKGLVDPSRATVLLRAQVDTLNGRGGLAAESLQTWLADHPRDAAAWQQLAAANAAAGRAVAAVRAEAEVNVAQLDYQAALTRFKAAQDLARRSKVDADHIDASIVDTRARQMESLLKEQALER